MTNLFFIGDIFGSPGRTIVARLLRDIISTEKLDLVIANAGNREAVAAAFARARDTWSVAQAFVDGPPPGGERRGVVAVGRRGGRFLAIRSGLG